MKAIQFLPLILLLSLFSCTKDENHSCTVNIQLISPEDYPMLSFQEIKVTLTNKAHGATYSSPCSSAGLATFDVEYGYYTVSAYYQSTSGLIFSGRIESLTLLAEQSGTTTSIKLPLSRSQTNALVIKEIYYGGCIGKRGEEYLADQYVTLYNNSDETIYLDGLCIAVVDPPGSIESPWMEYTDMKRIPVNDLTWQFPGSGKEHPLLPGTETTIATNAVNHTGGEYQHPNSVDLSTVDWGFWHVSLSRQNITPGVTPMKLISNLNPYINTYVLPIVGPTCMVFNIQETTAEAYINYPNNLEPRPQASNQNKRYLMIPKEWVIDCVSCVENINRLPFKRVPDELDHEATYIPNGLYSGKSLVRKSTPTANGRLVYQDTNNSAKDLIVSNPRLKNK